MLFAKFCSPALIYFTFILIHVMVAIHKKQNKQAILQLLVGTLMTLLLQLLCLRKMTIISWIIVFLPFIFYTYMMLILFHVFGLDPEDKVHSLHSSSKNPLYIFYS